MDPLRKGSERVIVRIESRSLDSRPDFSHGDDADHHITDGHNEDKQYRPELS